MKLRVDTDRLKQRENNLTFVTFCITYSFTPITDAASKVFTGTISPDKMSVVCEFMNKCFVLMFK
jgi:hypothetical protein